MYKESPLYVFICGYTCVCLCGVRVGCMGALWGVCPPARGGGVCVSPGEVRFYCSSLDSVPLKPLRVLWSMLAL